MKHRHILPREWQWVALVILLLETPIVLSQIVVDLSQSIGQGVNAEKMLEKESISAEFISVKDKVKIENIRVDTIIADPFDPARIDAITTFYDLTFQVCAEGTGVYLLPILTPEEYFCLINPEADFSEARIFGIAEHRIQVENIRYDRHISDPFATTEDVIDTVTTYHNVVFRFDPTTLHLVPLSTTVVPPQRIRIELNWGENPRDLDAHLTGPAPGAEETYSNEHDRFHLYFGNKISDIAFFDNIGQFSDTKPETLFISPPMNAETLRPGIYHYHVHHFVGNGSIESSQAVVRVWVNDDFEPFQEFTPPTDYNHKLGERSTDLWTVFELEIAADGLATILPVQTYSSGVNPFGVR